MKKTTAKVTHRDYVPYNWIAIEFCDVEFYGFRAEEMKRKWDNIKSKRYYTYNSLYEEQKAKIQNLRDKSEALYEQIKLSKPFYRFWYNKKEKEMLSEAYNLSNQADKLEKENKKILDKRLFNVYECHTEIEKLLQQNGFALTFTSSRGDECVTDTEIWTLEE